MNILIVDSEPTVRAGLIELCERDEELRVIGEVTLGAKAIEAAEELRPDLLLLDAELPDMSGLEVLRAMRTRHQRRTILVTASSEDGASAFAAGALDYLVKPVSPEAFLKSILRARECVKVRRATFRHSMHRRELRASQLGNEACRPLVLIGEREHRLYPLDLQEIDYIESAGNYVKYHLANADYTARESIKRLDAVLAPEGFVRIERSLLLSIR